MVRRKRILIFSSSESDDGNFKDINAHRVNDKTKRKIGPRPFSDLLILLRHSSYPPHVNPEDNDDNNSPILYSWEDLLKEMRWTNDKLKQVMTPDSYVIINGNTNKKLVSFVTRHGRKLFYEL